MRLHKEDGQHRSNNIGNSYLRLTFYDKWVAELSERASEEREELKLAIYKLSRARLELLRVLKALPLSEEELDEEAKRAVEEAREELAKKD